MTVEQLMTILDAYKKGKMVQAWTMVNKTNPDKTLNYFTEEWVDMRSVDEICAFAGQGKSLRLKPEPKYRAYKSVDEFLSAQSKHGPRMKVRYENRQLWCLPIDVEVVKDAVVITFNQNVIKSDVRGEMSAVTTDALVLGGSFHWQDGTVCGVLEE